MRETCARETGRAQNRTYGLIFAASNSRPEMPPSLSSTHRSKSPPVAVAADGVPARGVQGNAAVTAVYLHQHATEGLHQINTFLTNTAKCVQLQRQIYQVTVVTLRIHVQAGSAAPRVWCVFLRFRVVHAQRHFKYARQQAASRFADEGEERPVFEHVVLGLYPIRTTKRKRKPR